jgi:hypothetical protein
MTEPTPAQEPPAAPPAEPDHFHVWDILETQIPKGQAIHPRIRPENFTIVLVRCRTCNLPRGIEVPGLWNLEQILKNYAQIRKPGE